MKAKEIIYERVKSENFCNEKIGIVMQIDEDENAEDVMKIAKEFVAKEFVAKQFGEEKTEVKKTPGELVGEIKLSNCYHYSCNEEREVIDGFLNELKDMAEGNK